MNPLKSMLAGPENPPDALVWLQRRQTWAGDSIANRIRFVALAIFTANEHVNYFILHIVDKRFHIGSLLIVGLWALSAATFEWMLRRHHWPRCSPYLMVSIDLLWITWMLFLADGPRSPLVSVYFLIIALTGMRLNARISLCTAGGALFGYLAVLEFTKRQKPEFLVPVAQAVIVGISLLLMGIIMAHLVSRVLALLGESLKPDRS